MAFNSLAFLFVFLPVVLAGYYALTRVFAGQRPALVWLVAASLVFYALLGPGYLVVLLASVAGNFLVAWYMTRQPEGGRGRRTALIVGILANLALLGSYKYTGFVAENINALFGSNFRALAETYPVGLSFYTFIQIGFLLDAYAGQVGRLSFLRYVLFGTFFPYITAGPIVRQEEMFSQLDTPVRRRTGVMYIAVGLTMFAMGLFKKAVLADSVAPFVTSLFSSAAAGEPISAGNAWLGAFAFTLQVYFDFSGYSDMAIGLGFMLGLRLPLNFNSPLKATSLIDFWRRWHMTMVRFFTTYVYTPMAAGLMRRGVRRRYPEPLRLLLVLCLPVFVTFVLVGLWHGATWGFVISGVIHGVGLSVNLTWRELRGRFTLPGIPGVVGWALMIITVIVSNVFVPAPDMSTAMTVLGAMAGAGGLGAADTGAFYGTALLFNSVTYVPAVAWVAFLAAIALFFPRNTQEILEKYEVGLPVFPRPEARPRITVAWRPSPQWAFGIAVLVGLGLVFLAGPSPFLYYRF
jgi:D-alanyl-lipoteichoic acid acyltransferase DltB (MBOAT superfamily)